MRTNRGGGDRTKGYGQGPCGNYLMNVYLGVES